MAALSSRFLISPQCPKLNHYNSVIISFYPSICRFTYRVSELESWFFSIQLRTKQKCRSQNLKNIYDGSKPQVYTWTWKLLYEIQKLLFHIFVTTTKSSAYPTSFGSFFDWFSQLPRGNLQNKFFYLSSKSINVQLTFSIYFFFFFIIILI